MGFINQLIAGGAHIVSGMIGTLSLARPFLLLEIHRTAMETWLT